MWKYCLAFTFIILSWEAFGQEPLVYINHHHHHHVPGLLQTSGNHGLSNPLYRQFSWWSSLLGDFVLDIKLYKYVSLIPINHCLCADLPGIPPLPASAEATNAIPGPSGLGLPPPPPQTRPQTSMSGSETGEDITGLGKLLSCLSGLMYGLES